MADVPRKPGQQLVAPRRPGQLAVPRKEPGIGVLGALAIAVGVGVLGAYALDWHAHQCPCGARWRHLGAFNMGSLAAHTCPSCGNVQYWKDGVEGAFMPRPPSLRPLPAALPVPPIGGI